MEMKVKGIKLVKQNTENFGNKIIKKFEIYITHLDPTSANL